MNKSIKVQQQGQSIWYDNIERRMLENGDMAALINEGKIYGVTSNPSIFEKAIGCSTDYDKSLQAMAWAGMPTEQIYLQLVGEDIRNAADLFRPLYQQTNGRDGYVSLEIDPLLAYETTKSIDDGKFLWKLVDRPNLMIKVPATKAGLPVITALISAGINVNVTLIFSLERYREVMDAYMTGLEARLANGEPIDHIHSVGSFFVSRIDTLVDSSLEDLGRLNPGLATDCQSLKGQAAISNARLAYREFEGEFSSERFTRLAAHGANVQRPLWASTGTKNPDYSDTLYVDELVAPVSVNTVPPQTLDTYLVSGGTDVRIREDLPGAKYCFDQLITLGIDFDALTNDLEVDGVEKFKTSYLSLLSTIEKKRGLFRAELGPLVDAIPAAAEKAAEDRYVARMFDHDPTVWTDDPAAFDEIRNRLGWLSLPEKQVGLLDDLRGFAADCLEEGFTDAFVLGMGGSSLAPEVMSEAIASAIVPGHGLRLQIIDTTNPDEIAAKAAAVDIEKTLFVVSSKSGTTSETLSAMKYFWQKLDDAGSADTGRHFVAITDAGTPLEAYAREADFKAIFTSPANVGGRYSVFTQFGLVQAALMGLDLDLLLSRADIVDRQSRPEVLPAANPSLVLGLLLGEAALAGRDKLTFIADSYATHLVPWLEQLIAESSGKDGKGILPIDSEPLLKDLAYPDDRLFVYLQVDGSRASLAADLKTRRHPVVTIALNDSYDLGAEFYRWEFATAIACAHLGVNAFDQPDVQTNKTITKQKIADFHQLGRLDEGRPVWEDESASVFAPESENMPPVRSLGDLLRYFTAEVPERGYIVISAYVARDEANWRFFQDLRSDLLTCANRATTLGFGPRFLHSTGQLHKGGLPGGLFLIFTSDPKRDIEIPGEGMSFGELQRAQALGDYEALVRKGRRVLRVHLHSDLV